MSALIKSAGKGTFMATQAERRDSGSNRPFLKWQKCVKFMYIECNLADASNDSMKVTAHTGITFEILSYKH